MARSRCFSLSLLSNQGPTIALPCHWVSALVEFWLNWICQGCYMDFSRLLHGFPKLINGIFWVVTWICQNWYMDFFEFLHGFVKIVTWISRSCYIYLSKVLHVFLKLVTWICQIVQSMYFLSLAKQNQAEVWPRFQSSLKLLL